MTTAAAESIVDAALWIASSAFFLAVLTLACLGAHIAALWTWRRIRPRLPWNR